MITETRIQFFLIRAASLAGGRLKSKSLSVILGFAAFSLHAWAGEPKVVQRFYIEEDLPQLKSRGWKFYNETLDKNTQRTRTLIFLGGADNANGTARNPPNFALYGPQDPTKTVATLAEGNSPYLENTEDSSGIPAYMDIDPTNPHRVIISPHERSWKESRIWLYGEQDSQGHFVLWDPVTHKVYAKISGDSFHNRFKWSGQWTIEVFAQPSSQGGKVQH